MKSYKTFLGWPKGSPSGSSRERTGDKNGQPESSAASSVSGSSSSSVQPEPSPALSIPNTSTSDIPYFAPESPYQQQSDRTHTPGSPFDESSSAESASLQSRYPRWRASSQASVRSDQQSDIASIASSSPSTMSSVQSSLFSRARTSGTRSTVPSSRYSAKGLGAIAEGQSAGDATSNPVKLMKVVEDTQYSPAEEVIVPLKGPPKTRRTSTSRANNAGGYLMPEVAMDSAASSSGVSIYSRVPASPSNRAGIHSATSPSNQDFQNSSQYASSSSQPPPPPPPSNVGRPQNSSALILSNELKRLAENLMVQFDQANNRIAEVIFLAGNVSNSLASTLASSPLKSVEPGTISMHSEPALLTIIKVVLHFVDNLLNTNPLHRQRHILLIKLYTLGVRLKILPDETATSVHLPHNFAVGSIPELPCQEQVIQILELAASHASDNTTDQEGAFIAPVLRGFAPEFSVLSLIFGYPNPRPEHYQNMSSLCEFRPDVHMLCQKNYIRACGGGSFKAPFRVPRDPEAPPISMSLSKQNSATVSGTLGGYIFPRVDPGNEQFAQFSKSTFAITCAHVCIDKSGGQGTPINVPSTFLATLYRNALTQERDKFPPGTIEHKTYGAAVNEMNSKYLTGAAPEFGQVAWGERTVIGKHLSDVAIIKCNDNLKCKNYLGDDISFTEYDPALMFGNLYVKKVVNKPAPGMKVFKYGSTTKYTSGLLNGPRIVYWADGRLQSSEFVVSSNSPAFASGGDSGAWILQKNSDEEDYVDETATAGEGDNDDQGSTTTTRSGRSGPCLGVVGMLHSYDGERKEFGLYTPMTHILSRLEEVTHVKWGVVGIADDDEGCPVGGSDSSDDDDDHNSEGD